MRDIFILNVKLISAISCFIVFFILICALFSSLIKYDIFIEDNTSYVVTIKTDDCIEVINCVDIDFNYGSLLSSPDDYYTLQIDDVTFRNVPKSVTSFSYDVVYKIPQPNVIEFIFGDYDV